ncbi:hypothetical protein [Schleiferilactobacillus perolens]|uniref:Uncharacterized protein n=1 Tax=Schleiferilactobacillus perolens DSM 12744 TaxID=1423792 RepID=A0A0R1N057_9LACO|nr:hypothetical protein [Schleiferilactobacillus perolens]KRL13703.1 hypothetical protein FD09_GL001727 [Schleiferilactobacillus perolens DSM 12744]
MKIQSVVSALIITGSLFGVIAPAVAINATTSPHANAYAATSVDRTTEVVAQKTLQQLAEASPLPTTEKAQITRQIIEASLQARNVSSLYSVNSVTAGRYFKSYTTLSRAQVKAIAKEGDPVTKLTSFLSLSGNLFAVSAAFIYGSYYGYFTTAAINGWGIKITLTIDSYVPTSAGMSWSISYVK